MSTVRTIKDDLVERRLWPVALLLVVALIAVPLLLSDSGDSGGAGEPAASPTGVERPAALGDGVAGSAERSGGGTLQLTATAGSLGDPESRRLRDPFEPQGGADEVGTATAAEEQGPAQADASGTTTLAALDGDSGPAAADEAGASAASGGDTGGGGNPGSGGATGGDTGGGGGSGSGPAPGGGGGGRGGGGGGGGGSAPPPVPAPTELEYPIDARFGTVGATRARAGLEPLRALPSEENPVIVYLGASDDRGEATFLVSAELEVRGDGTCEPDRDTCTTLVLKPGDTTVFEGLDADGKPVRYELELQRVARTPVRIAAGSSASLALLTEPAPAPGAK